MKLAYKTYVNDTREWNRVETDEIEWCCDGFSRTLGNQIVYEPDPEMDEDIFIGFRQERRTGRRSTECVSINYCPFCGEEIVLDNLGTFKKVTEEVRVE